MSREFGDFQTPAPLVQLVLACLAQPGVTWQRVLEPTCGTGNFIRGVLDSPILGAGGEIQGIELQPARLARAQELAAGSARITLTNASIFDLNLERDLHWESSGRLLVIGNPPWVTNAELGALSSGNLPQKRNLKGLSGLEALTGGSNFDIAEAIWLKLIGELADDEPTIALLCKTSVARNVLQFAARTGIPISRAAIRRIDSKKWFDAAADACLFVVEVGGTGVVADIPVYADLTSDAPEQIMCIRGGNLIADVDAYEELAGVEGVFPFTWRQGIKHDAADVMELFDLGNGALQNRLGEPVMVEDAYVFPLLKSSDLYHARLVFPNRAVIVTQRHIGQDTAGLQGAAPKLWDYLDRHRAVFDRRKSSIYRDKPPFSIFGVGDYSFAAYKVAVSGLHKTPRFVALGPVDGRPVMLDDTCYFVSCESARQAAVIAALLNSAPCQQFLAATSFSDAKRPITKKLLQRIDLRALLRRADVREAAMKIEARIAPDDSYSQWPDDLEDLLTLRQSL